MRIDMDTQAREWKSLPTVPLRGLVAFPDTIFHFEAGRRKTIIALNQAAEQNTPVFLLTQKYDDHDAPTFAHGDFYKVGIKPGCLLD